MLYRVCSCVFLRWCNFLQGDVYRIGIGNVSYSSKSSPTPLFLPYLLLTSAPRLSFRRLSVEPASSSIRFGLKIFLPLLIVRCSVDHVCSVSVVRFLSISFAFLLVFFHLASTPSIPAQLFSLPFFLGVPAMSVDLHLFCSAQSRRQRFSLYLHFLFYFS